MNIKKVYVFLPFFLICFLILSEVHAARYVADHESAREEVLRSIPKEYIDAARSNLHIAYQHTSHGTHVTRGMFGMQEYKTGDDILFGVTFPGTRAGEDSSTSAGNKLDFHDYAINRSPYNTDTDDSPDLSANETAFVQLTRNYLDQNENINVVMWSWCNIQGHNVTENYLPGMQTLIDEYGPTGSKIVSEERTTPVTFVFMTGHANQRHNVGDGNPKNQADLIVEYCKTNGYFCLDYYSIDTHDMAGNYWEDAGDDGNSPTGGDFYRHWQDNHLQNVDWFENKDLESGSHAYGKHNTQDITANRKAYAMWWILARIAGWDPDQKDDNHTTDPGDDGSGTGDNTKNENHGGDGGTIHQYQPVVHTTILQLIRHIYMMPGVKKNNRQMN